MSAPVRSLGQLLRDKLDRPQPATWRNRLWHYAPAATHGDSSAFRARMAEYARRASRDTDAAEAAKSG